jgi:hypothetical protein
MRRYVLVGVIAMAVVATPAAASPVEWWFKTPGGAAYCGVDAGGWICARPADGFWLRLTGYLGRTVDVRKGRSERFRGLRPAADRTLGFGDVIYTSDAAIVTCWSRPRALTCKHTEGLSFTLGRRSGFRIFWDAPGIAPNVLPLFRTRHDVRCGIDRENLEPTDPVLTCWRARDGLRLDLVHSSDQRAQHSRWEIAMGLRPPGFVLLPTGRTFEWRCRDVTSSVAERCSVRSGEPVFTCTSTEARVTCRNRSGHGFWASARSFYTL